MYHIKGSLRLKEIENEYNSDIEDLLYQMHWSEDMMHKEIGGQLGIPRATITRWFRLLNIPSQSCRRFTDKNLTSWLYKTGKLKKKLRYNGPDRRLQRTKGNVNIEFFKRWSPEMAYVLGYFAADGGMFVNPEGSKYIQFVSTDKEILQKIKRLVCSNHKIGIKKRPSGNLGWKVCYLIQIGSKEMYNDLLELGFTPKKDLTLKFPEVLDRYLSHFVRGYFDGDGGVSFGFYKTKIENQKTKFYIQTYFVCGSKKFLAALSEKIHKAINISKGSLKNKSHNRAYQLSYSTNDSERLFRYMYGEADVYCYLERKYNKFVKAITLRGDVA